MSSDTRRANASLSLLRWSLLVASTWASSAAALWPRFSICCDSRAEASRADRWLGQRCFDFAQTVLDAFADDRLERLPGLRRQLAGAFRDHRLDGFAGALRGMGRGVLDLDQRRDQRGPGLGAEAAGFALGLDDDRGQLGDLRLRVSDPFVDRGEQGREAVLLLADLRSRLRNPLARLDRGIADPADFGLDRPGRLSEPVGAALSLADRDSDTFANVGGEAVDMLAQRRGPLGQRPIALSWAPDWAASASSSVRARVSEFRKWLARSSPLRGELGEALVDQRQPAIDLGDHPLRRALLLGHPAR